MLGCSGLYVFTKGSLSHLLSRLGSCRLVLVVFGVFYQFAV